MAERLIWGLDSCLRQFVGLSKTVSKSAFTALLALLALRKALLHFHLRAMNEKKGGSVDMPLEENHIERALQLLLSTHRQTC